MKTFAAPCTIGLLLTLCLSAPSAHALVSRAWVASNGSDANPCTRASPCAHFQAAHNNLVPGGEINCVDNGNFASVLITKTITIDCAATFAGDTTTPFMFRINAPGVTVKLRNLSLNGLGTFGNIGVEFQAGAALFIENCTIIGFRFGAGIGISFQPSASAKLVVSNSAVSDNGIGALIRPTGGAEVQVIFDRVTTAGGVVGIKVDGSGQATGQIDVDVRDSVSAHNANNGFIAVSDAGQAPIHYKITRSSAFNNGAFGAVATGAQAFMIVSGSSLTKNGTGLAQLSGSTVATYTNNDVNFNTTNVSGVITTIAQR